MKLRIFWREGLLSIRERIMIYTALIGTRLTYGLHTLPLKDELMNKIDAFHVKELRQILKMKPTFIDRGTTNAKVLELSNTAANKPKNMAKERRQEGTLKKVIVPMSEVVVDRAIKDLGEIIWLPDDDPRRQVTLSEGEMGELVPNLPECRRVGRPRTNWIETIMGRIWKKLPLDVRSEWTRGQTFSIKKDAHLRSIIEAAQLEEF